MDDKMMSIVNRIEAENPYKVKGKHNTYSQYNEGWNDCCGRFGGGVVIDFIVTFVIMYLLLKGLSIYKDYLKVRENSYDEFLEKKQILQEKMEQKKRESEQ